MLSDDDQKGFQDKDDRIERLLESATSAIKAALGKDFKPLENVMRVYCGNLQPIPWLDELPALALAGRTAVKRDETDTA